jgi:thiamine kinase-like enzyme
LEEPTCPEEINLNWIEQVFDKAHIFQKPISFNIDKYFKTQSLLGDIIRIELKYPIDCNSPKTIIVKFQKCTDKEREGKVYRLLKDRKIKSIPKVLHICSTGTIVLEDLSKYSTGSMVNGCTFEQIKQIISIIVQVHSEYWNKNVGPAFNYKRFALVFDYNMQQSWEQFKSRYRKIMGSTEKDFEWLWKNSEIVSKLYCQGNTTLNHGDLHLENILFDYDHNDTVIIDWQLSERKSPAFDISYFLIQNLTVEQRDKYENLFLEYYYNLLSEHIKNEYSFNLFLLEYRICVSRSMLSTVMYNGFRFKHRSDQPVFSDIIAQRVINAVKKWKPVDAINEYELKYH